MKKFNYTNKGFNCLKYERKSLNWLKCEQKY